MAHGTISGFAIPDEIVRRVLRHWWPPGCGGRAGSASGTRPGHRLWGRLTTTSHSPPARGGWPRPCLQRGGTGRIRWPQPPCTVSVALQRPTHRYHEGEAVNLCAVLWVVRVAQWVFSGSWPVGRCNDFDPVHQFSELDMRSFSVLKKKNYMILTRFSQLLLKPFLNGGLYCSTFYHLLIEYSQANSSHCKLHVRRGSIWTTARTTSKTYII